MDFRAPLHGLTVRIRGSDTATAYLEGLTETFDLDHLGPILDELKNCGTTRVFIDVSGFPSKNKLVHTGLVGGYVKGRGLEVKYSGITREEAISLAKDVRYVQSTIIPDISLEELL